MIGGPPTVWGWLWREWVPMPASVSWVLWRALCKAQYPPADAWRARLNAFDAPDRLLSRDLVEDFLQEIATPHALMEVVEALMKEHVLLRRDGHRVQEQILRHVTASGQWKHHRGRRQSA
jgi:hypothetical protein